MKEVCDRVMLRPANWQAFCSDNEGDLTHACRCRHTAYCMSIHTHTHMHVHTHTLPYNPSPVAGTLALLSKCVLFLNEGVSPFLLKLLYIGVSGHPLKTNDKGVPNSEVKPGGELKSSSELLVVSVYVA